VPKEKKAPTITLDGKKGLYQGRYLTQLVHRTQKPLKGEFEKEYFLFKDYILWINQGDEGTQKMDRGVKGLFFWRYIPVSPGALKISLRQRGLYTTIVQKRYKQVYVRRLLSSTFCP